MNNFPQFVNVPKFNLEEELAILKAFDFDWRFGPVSGITRSRRYHRAAKTGVFKPPVEVLEIIERVGGCAENSYLAGYPL